MAGRILLVEDNEPLAQGIRHNLELEGYEVEWIEDGSNALEAIRERPPALLILDLMLPGMNGFEVLRGARQGGFERPVLILSARSDEVDKVRGFRLGADQYLTKPFGLLELLERVKTLLRRHRNGAGPAASPPEAPDEPIRFGDVEIRPAARTARKAGEEVSLTPRAFDLLLALVRHEGKVVSRQDLLVEVWGHRAAVVTRTVDSHISELRRALEDDPSGPEHIHTVWKIGYRFER